MNKRDDTTTPDTMTKRPGRQNHMDTERKCSDKINGRSTPNRKIQHTDNNSKGRYESPGKKLRLERFNSAVRFWGRGPTSTSLQGFNSHTRNTEQSIGDHQDPDIDLSSKGHQ